MPSYSNPAARTAVGIEEVPPVDDQGRAHRVAHLGRCELLQLRPLGHDHRCVRVPHRVEQRRSDGDPVELGMAR